MNALRFYIIALTLLLGLPPLMCQDLKENLDATYGLSPKLYNGKLYADSYNRDVNGHPFLMHPDYENGHLKLRQGKFRDLKLNYDIYTQKVLLKFETQNKASRQIEIPLEHLLEFNLQERHFVNLQEEDQSFQIYQVIGGQETKFYIHWYKKLETVKSSSSFKHEFTEARKTFYLVRKEQLTALSNNKSLRLCFPEEQHADIKKWMKSQGINLKKASDQQILMLSQYLDSL